MPFRALSAGGVDTSDATAGPENIENGYTAYTSSGKETGTLQKNARAVATSSLTVPSPPSVSVTAEIVS